uniref:Disease resistance protein At4g27190-like leucine-rich repeats domain-containing protein n=1 Tax=Oryza glumipatula TaxID=40148 RepID=A0A0D9ZGX7_9ORYZ
MQILVAISVEEAVQKVIPYLEDTSSAADKSIYFEGWGGLGASAVLRAIAENPAPSLRKKFDRIRKKFDRIIHVDCSRWKSRRQLQRAIADKLELPQHVMDLFDRQDEEDDFSWVEESSRAEIADIRKEIYRAIKDLSCLLIFHNGSDDTAHINICISSTPKDATPKKKTMSYYSTQKVVGSPLHMPIVTTTQPAVCYKDVNLTMISSIDFDISSAPRHEPLDIHVEIGEGISYANMISEHALSAVSFVMNKAESLHVHDNFSITSVNPKHVILTGDKEIRWHCLKRCHVERCHRLNPVFSTDYTYISFRTLEAFSAAELMMANCIWSRGTNYWWYIYSFAELKSIHLHYCPRLTFVLPLSWPTLDSHLPSLETLHIVYCSELRQIFPVEEVALRKQPRGVLRFPKLKHIHLHDVPKLHQICEISRRMVAPVLETIRVRGCWALKRIPAIDGSLRGQDSRPIVDCEKDWWEKLEWEGMNVGHDPSLFEPRHSMYYKKALPRCSLLRMHL